MIKKIENIINKGEFTKASELLRIELGKNFDFKNKKDREKYLTLKNILKKLGTDLKTLKARKTAKGKGGLIGIYNAGEVINSLLGIDVSKSTKIKKFISDNQLLKKKFNELVSIAKTKNNEYLEQLLFLSNTIDEDEATILIYGETGVGKSYLAAQMHNLSPRKKNKFVAINCGALSKSDLYANLFGAKKGTYTGATVENVGKVEKARGGTLFIDEIDKAPQDVRYSLLTFIETKKYYRYGENEELEADVRIIVGTNKDLKELVKKEMFEEDFYYRITKRIFHIPPLRKRKEDIPLIIDWVLKEFNNRKGISIKIDKTAIELLSEYPWYGNFRELNDYLNMILSHSYLWMDIIVPELIRENPPEKYPLKSNDHLQNIESVIRNNLEVWDPDFGKFLNDYLEPVVAKIYMEDYNPQMSQSKKYEQAMNIIGISGDRRSDSTLHKQYLKYNEIIKKLS